MDAVKCAQNTMARFSRIRYNHCDIVTSIIKHAKTIFPSTAD